MLVHRRPREGSVACRGPAVTVPVESVSPRTLRRDYRRVLDDLSTKGDLVWIDVGHQRSLLVNSPEYVREALIERADTLVKPDSQTIETGPPAPAPADEGIPVAEFRAALTKGMGPGRIPDVLASVTAAAAAEVEHWRDGMHLPLMPRMRRLAVVATCGSSFGSRLDPDELKRAERAVRRMGRIMLVNSPVAHRLDRLKLNRLRRRRGRRELIALSHNLIANADLSRPSELTALVEDLPRLAPALTAEDRQALFVELFLGAVAPLAQTAGWTLLHFGIEKDAAARLRAEWEGVLLPGNAIDHDALARLRYTEAFVREVTRLHPTNPRITRHALGESKLGSERIPKNTRVILNVNALHRSPRLFEQPKRFVPERWLDGRPGAHKFAYVAFGVGGRRCIGETMAMASLVAMLPILGRDWDFEFPRIRVSVAGRHQPAESVKARLHAYAR
jgi:cytochrome P450